MRHVHNINWLLLNNHSARSSILISGLDVKQKCFHPINQIIPV